MRPFNPAHAADPVLAVIDVVAEDDATPFAVPLVGVMIGVRPHRRRGARRGIQVARGRGGWHVL
ncbi:DUF6207 family protein [Streptomyces sp. NPDC020802]|uniref:DUF6207 family protein n=1 Tax=Streptomyces sp. NPDC020802 TaxID=3365094 RepID=UPI00379A7DDC